MNEGGDGLNGRVFNKWTIPVLIMKLDQYVIKKQSLMRTMKVIVSTIVSLGFN